MADSALPEAGTPFGERVRRRLREEQVIWITTVDKRGTPQPNPVGFLYQEADGCVLIYNMLNANRLANIADRPHVALHFDGDGSGGDIVVFSGIAHRVENVPPPHGNPDYLKKYGESLLQVSQSAEDFGKRFAVPLQVTITRTRGR